MKRTLSAFLAFVMLLSIMIVCFGCGRDKSEKNESLIREMIENSSIHTWYTISTDYNFSPDGIYEYAENYPALKMMLNQKNAEEIFRDYGIPVVREYIYGEDAEKSLNAMALMDMMQTLYPDLANTKLHYMKEHKNWGLSLEVASATPSGIQIQCVQSGGEPEGELVAECYCIISNEADEWMTYSDSEQIDISLSSPIAKDAKTNLTLDWTDFYGALSSGSYALALYITDEYENQEDPASQAPDIQIYYLVFSVE